MISTIAKILAVLNLNCGRQAHHIRHIIVTLECSFAAVPFDSDATTIALDHFTVILRIVSPNDAVACAEIS
jgi:hypothetical protein